MSTIKPNFRRLNTLYGVIAGIPDERIRLDSWRDHTPLSDRQEETTNQMLRRNECGSVACAVGWACAYPPFRKSGLGWNGVRPTYRRPGTRGDTHNGWSAVHAFFGLTGAQATALFVNDLTPLDPGFEDRYRLWECLPTSWSRKETVLSRLSKFIKSKGTVSVEWTNPKSWASTGQSKGV